MLHTRVTRITSWLLLTAITLTASASHAKVVERPGSKLTITTRRAQTDRTTANMPAESTKTNVSNVILTGGKPTSISNAVFTPASGGRDTVRLAAFPWWFVSWVWRLVSWIRTIGGFVKGIYWGQRKAEIPFTLSGNNYVCIAYDDGTCTINAR